MQDRPASIGTIIKARRRELGISQVELSRIAGINQGYLSQIERGQANPRARTVDALASALALPSGLSLTGIDHDAPQAYEAREIPLLGTIPAGPPATSQESPDVVPVLRHQWAPHCFCLRLAFDSMEPTLKPGDIVLVQYRPGVEPEHVQGRICACLVDGEATLKRVSVEYRDDRRFIILRGDNPRLAPMLIDDTRTFAIQGVVVRLVCREL